MGPILDIAGLTSSFVGVVLMTRYSLPFHLLPLNGFARTLSEQGHHEDGRRNLIGLVGLLLFGVGTVLQIFVVVMK